ncbi:MAG: hypothetical protein D6820_09630, partial [Lentisphaerae bacterium]
MTHSDNEHPATGSYQYELDLEQVEPDPVSENQREVMDYLDESHWRFGLEFVNRVHSITYFLPLLRELFHGPEARVRVVFAILYHLMLDERIRWSRAELDEKFHWLKPGQRNYILQRLSNAGWIEYYRDQGVYMITDKGETLMRILSRLTLGETLVESEGAALAEIEFSMLLDFDDLPERLQFLHNRLLKHNIRAQNALQSQSSYRMLEVFDQLQQAYRWAEQTRQTLDQIQVAADDEQLWKILRSVHNQLSRLHAQISEMQLTLQEIQKRQINIARYGLTQIDYDHFLINVGTDKLAAIVQKHLNKIPHPLFIQQNFALLEAHEILSRDLPENNATRGWDTELADPEYSAPPDVPVEAKEFSAILDQAPADWNSVSEVLAIPNWESAAYR